MTASHDLGPTLVVGDSHLAHEVVRELAARNAPCVRPGDALAWEQLGAAVFCDDDDPANIAGAIDLRERAPATRIVLRSFNSRIADRLPELLGDCRVLSASRIAAPHICDAAVGTGGPEHGPRRRTWATRAVDRVRGSSATAVGRQLWRRPLLRWSLAGMALLVLVQTLVARAAFGYDAVESLHVGIASITTFGFADSGLAGVALADEAPAVQVAATLTMLIDVVLVTVLLALVADALIGERFARVFGGSARRLRGHVVIAGLGTVGFRVLDELHRRGYRCAVIEADDDGPFVAAARRLGAHVTIADVRQEEEFGQLSIDRAAASRSPSSSTVHSASDRFTSTGSDATPCRDASRSSESGG